jgi:hypothetical protein
MSGKDSYCTGKGNRGRAQAGSETRRVGVHMTVNTDARFILQYCCRRRRVLVNDHIDH